jgi:D-arabinose 5-phosphate isomerase GutQ
MGFHIPNAPLASVIDQSEPDSGDFKALGDRKTGVISGCLVSANSTPNQTVTITDGEVISNGVFCTLTGSGGTTSLSLGQGTAGAARFDIVVINSTGTLTARTGTAGSNPTFPTLEDGDVFLAAVYRASGTSDIISSTRIIDKRVITPSSMVRSGSGAPSSSLGAVGDIYINTSVSSSTGQSQVYLKTTSSLWENLAEYYPTATANTANTLVQRDGSGNFSAGTITANLTGTATAAPWTGITGRPTVGNVTVGTSATPSGGSAGDIYIQVA